VSLAMPPSEPSEEWRSVTGYEGRYLVSNIGRVFSVPRIRTQGGILIPRLKMGYFSLRLYRPGGGRDHFVHALTAEAFIGPRPTGMVVRHLDGDCLNNQIENLAYGTHGDNERDTVRHGRHRNARKTHCIRGHSLSDPANLRPMKNRNCRICQAQRDRERYLRRKLSLTPVATSSALPAAPIPGDA
jgi:hypothetical protein